MSGGPGSQLRTRKESVPRIIQEFNASLANDLKRSNFARPSIRFGQPERVPQSIRLPSHMRGMNCDNLLQSLLSDSDRMQIQNSVGSLRNQNDAFYLTVADNSKRSLMINTELQQHLKNHPSRKKIFKRINEFGHTKENINMQSIQKFRDITEDEQKLMRIESSRNNLFQVGTPNEHSQDQGSNIFLRSQMVYIFTDG